MIPISGQLKDDLERLPKDAPRLKDIKDIVEKT